MGFHGLKKWDVGWKFSAGLSEIRKQQLGAVGENHRIPRTDAERNDDRIQLGKENIFFKCILGVG